MKIHSDILTPQDILASVPDSCYLAPFDQPGFGRTRIGMVGSRSRENGFIVRLAGSSRYHMRSLPHKSATWDEWGIFIAALYELDDDALIGHYGGHENFIADTKAAFERVSKWRPDLGIRAPWLAS